MLSNAFDYPIDEDLQRAVAQVLARRIHHGGPYTAEAERRIADAFGCAHGVAVNSGSAAGLIIMHALGVGPGDEVIVPGTSYITSAEIVALRGATPIFVECEPDTLNVDVGAVRNAITERTRGIIAVHTYGHPVDLDALAAVANEHGIWLVENCAHAFGARYAGRPVGSVGIAGFTALSRKHLSVCGTGGVAFSNDSEVAEAMRKTSIHGRDGYHAYESYVLGYNFRFNEIQACITCRQLDLVDEWIRVRQAHARRYVERFEAASVPLELPLPRPYAEPSYLDFVVQTDRRDALREYLALRSIRTIVRYAVPCHLHPVFRDMYGHGPGMLPAVERACGRILSLPVAPDLTSDDIDAVADATIAFFEA